MRKLSELVLLAAVLAAVPARGQETPEFSLALSANGAGRPELHRGEPLLVEVLLVLERGEAAKLALRDSRPWTDALKLALTDADGKIVEVDWQLLGAAGTRMEFTAEASEARAVVALSPESAGALAAGDYLLKVSYDTGTLAEPDSWTGAIQARMTLQVTGAAREDSDAAFVTGQRLVARWQLLSGRSEESLASLETALGRSPEDISALADKAEALLALQRRDEAVSVLELAIASFRKQNPQATHPPRELLRRLRQLQPL